MKSRRFISISVLSFLSVSLFSGVFAVRHSQNKGYTTIIASASEVESYYSSITDDLKGDDLLKALNALNKSKRKKTVSYAGMKTFSAYSDADPDGSGKIIGFYDNTKIGPAWDNAKTWNREHVWPNARGGSKVEGDAHMTRPASVSTNSDRGSKGFSTDSYDPGKSVAFYRGVASRIIFYAAIADTSLKIIEDPLNNNTSEPANSMGRLSDMLTWNMEYLPSDTSFTGQDDLARRTELNRNEVIQNHSDGQGNRNPFIDHPEYACRIWGNANAQAKAACAKYLEPSVTIDNKTVSIEEEKTTQISAFSTNSSTITWIVEDDSIVSLSASSSASNAKITLSGVKPGKTTVTAKATIDGKEYSDTCSVTVTAKPVPVLTSITLSGNYKTAFKPGDAFTYEGLVVTANYTIGGSKEVTGYKVDAPDMSTAGNKTVTVSYTENDVTKSATYQITVDSLQSISVSGGKRSFVLNGTFSYEGLVVTAHYSVAADRTVTPTDVSTPDLSSLGTKDVTVSYTENEITKTATYQIEVKEEVTPVRVESVSLNETKKTLEVGDTFQLVATINPSNADNQNVTWSCDSLDGYEGCATVSESGLVTAVSVGYATITVKTVDGNKTATCSLKIVEEIKPTPTPSSSSKGCGGNIATTSVILSTLALSGVVILFLKKKKENK